MLLPQETRKHDEVIFISTFSRIININAGFVVALLKNKTPGQEEQILEELKKELCRKNYDEVLSELLSPLIYVYNQNERRKDVFVEFAKRGTSGYIYKLLDAIPDVYIWGTMPPYKAIRFVKDKNSWQAVLTEEEVIDNLTDHEDMVLEKGYTGDTSELIEFDKELFKKHAKEFRNKYIRYSDLQKHFSMREITEMFSVWRLFKIINRNNLRFKMRLKFKMEILLFFIKSKLQRIKTLWQ